jgi:uncharacterized Zn-finger protein
MQFMENCINPEDNSKFYRCKLCGKISAHSFSLRRHLIIKHSKPTIHTCQFCSKQFQNQYSLQNHIYQKVCLKNMRFDV